MLRRLLWQIYTDKIKADALATRERVERQPPLTFKHQLPLTFKPRLPLTNRRVERQEFFEFVCARRLINRCICAQ